MNAPEKLTPPACRSIAERRDPRVQRAGVRGNTVASEDFDSIHNLSAHAPVERAAA